MRRSHQKPIGRIAHRHGPAGPRERGSAIILVVAALVLSMLMGLAYMSTARQDRHGTAITSTTKDLDQVEQSVISRIIDVLREDLGHARWDELDAEGTPTGETASAFFQTRGVGDERPPFRDQDRPPIDYPGEVPTEGPGIAYSPWLASTAPLWHDPTEPDEPTLVWPQITRLTDEYVDQGDQWWVAAESVDAGAMDEGDAATFMSVEGMADAAGDGIFDSRWERAPIFSLGGVDYYMAVRIVDNSAKLNANVAFSQIATTGQYDPDYNQSLRWEYPTELDLGSLVYRYGSLLSPEVGRGLLEDEVEPFIEWRVPAMTQTMPIPPEEREQAWDIGYYGNLRGTTDTPQLGIDSEISLRYRDGLNNRRLESGIESSERGLPWTLRQYPGEFLEAEDRAVPERTWWDAYENMLADVENPPYAGQVTRDDMVNYFEMNPRAQLTTLSGYGPHGETNFKHDLKTLIQEEDLDTFIEQFWQVYGGEGLAADPGEVVPRGLRQHDYWSAELGSDTERLFGFAAQYAVNLLAFTQGGPDQFLHEGDVPADPMELAMPRYIWPENAPQSGTEQMRNYGMRPLPYITEVYSQQKYVVNQVEEDTPADGDVTVTWEAVATAGYVIEIRNPHNYPIRVDAVRVIINDPDESRLLSEIVERSYMEPDEAIYLMRHSGGFVSSEAESQANPPEGPQDPEEDDVVKVVTDTLDEEALSPTWVMMDQPDRDVEWMPAGGGGDPITVELVAAVRDVADPADDEQAFVETHVIDGQAWYRYQKADGQITYRTPIEVVHEQTDPGLEVDDEGWEQQTIIGDGRGLNMITVRPGQFVESLRHKRLDEEGHEHDPDYGVTLGMIGKQPHGPEGPIVAWDNEQLIFPKEGRLRNVGELALITSLGPRQGDTAEEWTLAHAWDTPGGPVESVRDFQTTVGAVDVDGNLLDTLDDLHDDGVTHMTVLMDRFSAHRYWDSEEQPARARFTPGTININTATRETLLAALPVPWDDVTAEEREQREATRRQIVDAILAYRDNVANWRPPDPWRQEPGIRYIGEIYAATWHLFGDTGDDAYDIGGVRIDRLSNPREQGAAPEPDGIVDDLEEKTMVLRMLSQLLTTRSEVYTAHILIRGYPSTQDPPEEPVVERRLMAIFDRTPVFDVDENQRAGMPRVLGVYRY